MMETSTYLGQRPAAPPAPSRGTAHRSQASGFCRRVSVVLLGCAMARLAGCEIIANELVLLDRAAPEAPPASADMPGAPGHASGY